MISIFEIIEHKFTKCIKIKTFVHFVIFVFNNSTSIQSVFGFKSKKISFIPISIVADAVE